MKDLAPKFCFLCGRPLEETGLGFYVCTSGDCSEIFLPFVDVDGYQNLQAQTKVDGLGKTS